MAAACLAFSQTLRMRRRARLGDEALDDAVAEDLRVLRVVLQLSVLREYEDFQATECDISSHPLAPRVVKNPPRPWKPRP